MKKDRKSFIYFCIRLIYFFDYFPSTEKSHSCICVCIRPSNICVCSFMFAMCIHWVCVRVCLFYMQLNKNPWNGFLLLCVFLCLYVHIVAKDKMINLKTRTNDKNWNLILIASVCHSSSLSRLAFICLLFLFL